MTRLNIPDSSIPDASIPATGETTTKNDQEALNKLTDFMGSLVRYSQTQDGDDICEDDIGSMSFKDDKGEHIYHFTHITSIMVGNKLEMVEKTGTLDAQPSFDLYTAKESKDMSTFVSDLDALSAKLAWAAKLARQAGFGPADAVLVEENLEENLDDNKRRRCE